MSEELSKLGDQLEKLDTVMEWRIFESILNRVFMKEHKSAGGRPPYSYLLLFKILILQRLFNISDDQAEFQINDRMTFRRFLGLSLGDPVPDAKTIWLFHDTLLKFGEERSKPIESLRIIDDELFAKCQRMVKERAIVGQKERSSTPVHTKSRSILTGFLFCAHCHSRMTYAHNVTKRTLADGTLKAYERDMYRCYRKISARNTCDGQSSYDMKVIDSAVEAEVHKLLSGLSSKPKVELLGLAVARSEEMLRQSCKHAEKDYESALKQLNALEDEAVKAIAGESPIELSLLNGMLIKQRAKLDECMKVMERARQKFETEMQNCRSANANVSELLSWGACFDTANIETKHMVLSRLIDRVEVSSGYKIQIHFKVAYEQFTEKPA